MYMGEALFLKGHQSSYLQQQLAALGPFVERQMSGLRTDANDDDLIARMLKEAIVAPLTVEFDRVTKDVQSGKVRVHDYGREIVIDGVRATRTYPYSGERSLFQLRPNRWSSVLPYGAVTNGSVTVGIEGRNDAESIKREMDRQETTLREYVEWQRGDVEQHNSGLKPKIEHLVRRRREHLDSVARLKDQV